MKHLKSHIQEEAVVMVHLKLIKMLIQDKEYKTILIDNGIMDMLEELYFTFTTEKIQKRLEFILDSIACD